MPQKDTKNSFTTGFGVERQENESIGSLARRFTQRVRQSGRLYEARKRRYLQPEVNKRQRRESALVRAERKEKYKKMRKWGKL